MMSPLSNIKMESLVVVYTTSLCTMTLCDATTVVEPLAHSASSPGSIPTSGDVVVEFLHVPPLGALVPTHILKACGLIGHYKLLLVCR